MRLAKIDSEKTREKVAKNTRARRLDGLEGLTDLYDATVKAGKAEINRRDIVKEVIITENQATTAAKEAEPVLKRRVQIYQAYVSTLEEYAEPNTPMPAKEATSNPVKRNPLPDCPE